MRYITNIVKVGRLLFEKFLNDSVLQYLFKGIVNVKKVKERIWIIRLLATLLTFLVFVIVNYMSNTGIFREYTVLKWDASGQYINWMAYLMDILKGNSNELLYTLSITPGNSNALLVGWYLLSPFNILLFFFDKQSLPDAYYWIECIKICAAGFTMSVFITRLAIRKNVTFDLKKISIIIICCVGYSYSGFIAGHTHQLLYFDSYLILPLLADSIIKIKYDNKSLQYYLCLLYAIVTNFYFGFMTCIFSTLFYLYLSFRNKFSLKNFAIYIFTSIIAAGSSLAVLLPIGYQVPLSKLSGENGQLFSFTRWALELLIIITIMAIIYIYYIIFTSYKYNRLFSGFKRYIMDLLLVGGGAVILHQILNKLAWYGDYIEETILFPSRMLFGVFSIDDYQPTGLMSIYCGIPVLILLIAYLLDYRTDKKIKIINVQAIVFCYFMMGFKHLNYVWHGFTYPAGSFYRWAFFISFFLIMIGAEYFFDISEKESLDYKKLLQSHGTYIFLLAFFMISVLCLHYYRRSIYSFLNIRSIIFSIVFFASYLIIYYISKKGISILNIVAVVIFCVEIVANALISVEGFTFTSYKEYNSYLTTMSDIMNDIEQLNDSDIYRIESDYKKEWYYIGGYNTIYHSSSAYTARNRDYMSLLGMGVNDETKLLEASNNFDLDSKLAGAIGIRYLISENELNEDDYNLIGSYLDEYSNTTYYMYYNKASIPIAYVAPLESLEVESAEDGLELMEYNVSKYCSDDGNSGLVSKDNSKYEVYTISDEDEAIVFSLPYEDNWELYIDGEKVSTEKAYGFFLAAKVSKGEHVITIKYIPPFLILGLVMSIISIIIYVVFLYIQNKRMLTSNNQ